MNLAQLRLRSIWRGVGYAAAVIAPLLLLINPQVNFARDWPTHLWLISYYGDYFRQHGDFPLVVNNTVAVGAAVPVFYTWLLYPLLGILAAVVGAGLALRVALLILMTVQFYALVSAGRKILGHSAVATTVAVAVIWSSYSLTNLYNRGAIAEYFATGFLFTAIGFGASAAIAGTGSARWFHGWLAGVFLILAMSAHPPTAVLAGAFVALLAGGVAVAWWRGRFRIPRGVWLRLAGGILVGAIILSPWIYASASLGSQLLVTRASGAFTFRPDHSDSLGARFAPFPYDVVTMKYGVYDDEHGTPYLEAPINFVLLGILLWNLELLRRSRHSRQMPVESPASPVREILIVAVAWFLMLAALSVSPWLAGFFDFFAPYIQYVYRLVTHCNAALLVAVFATGVLVTRQAGYRRFRHQTNLVVAVCLTTAILGLWIKLEHGVATILPADNRATTAMGNPIDLTKAYATPAILRPLNREEIEQAVPLRFPVGDAGAHFGDIGAAAIRMSRAGWVVTNAVVFPWFQLESDGKKLAPRQLARLKHFTAVYLTAGVHEIRAVWRPDPLWTFLHVLSQTCFLVVLAATLVWAAAQWHLKRADSRRIRDQVPV